MIALGRVAASKHSFQLNIQVETVAIVPRAVGREVHR
jgi:hypothetical protein